MLQQIKGLVPDSILKISSPEINEHTMKLIVGVIALMLAYLTNKFSGGGLASISESYHVGGWSRDIFVGFLFAISAFLLSYNGKPPLSGQSVKKKVDRLLISQPFQKLISKVAAISAIGVAIFPCECGSHAQLIPGAHAISAFLMFFILSVFCFVFYKRARCKSHWHAKVRASFYAACGSIILICILAIGLQNMLLSEAAVASSRLTFYCESIALYAFGVSWILASQKLVLTKDESGIVMPYVGV